MTSAKKTGEQSMDDILASIRKIIAHDRPGAEASGPATGAVQTRSEPSKSTDERRVAGRLESVDSLPQARTVREPASTAPSGSLSDVPRSAPAAATVASAGTANTARSPFEEFVASSQRLPESGAAATAAQARLVNRSPLPPEETAIDEPVAADAPADAPQARANDGGEAASKPVATVAAPAAVESRMEATTREGLARPESASIAADGARHAPVKRTSSIDDILKPRTGVAADDATSGSVEAKSVSTPAGPSDPSAPAAAGLTGLSALERLRASMAAQRAPQPKSVEPRGDDIAGQPKTTANEKPSANGLAAGAAPEAGSNRMSARDITSNDTVDRPAPTSTDAAPVAIGKPVEAARPAVAAKAAVHPATMPAQEVRTELSAATEARLEDLVRELLRPMVRTWLDENLSRIAADVVREEQNRS